MNICYYSADKKIFVSKLEAFKYKERTGNEIYFYYHDDLYAAVDWKTEPPNSIDFYYREQAQRIRDNYDYVILCYSGGYDSSNILETFYFNNIKLDKIVVVGALSQDSHSGVDDNHNGELYHNIFPYLKELDLESITQVCDYSKMFNDPSNFCIYQYGNDWVNHVNGWYSPHNWFWMDLEKHVVPEQYKDKKVAIIFGKDKPELRDGLFRFTDTRITSYAYKEPFNQIHRINFYWDPEYPQILVKQLHMLSRSNLTPDQTVYNLRRPLVFKSPKSPNNIISLRDKFLLNHLDSKIFDFYKSGVNVLLKATKEFRVRPIQSRAYGIK